MAERGPGWLGIISDSLDTAAAPPPHLKCAAFSRASQPGPQTGRQATGCGMRSKTQASLSPPLFWTVCLYYYNLQVEHVGYKKKC